MNRKEIQNEKVLVIAALFIFLVTFLSCAPEYIPNMVNSPMFSNKGEFQANASTGTSSLDVQAAYAITDHIGMMVNGSFADRTKDSLDNFHKHTILEGGIGYYDKFGDIGRYEIFGGYGTGRIEGRYTNIFSSHEIADARYNRFFLQPGIGIATGIYDGSFSSRLALVQMNPDGIGFETGNYHGFLEPVFTSKIGYRYLKFTFQIGFSIPIGKDELKFDYQPFIFNVGANLNLGRLYDD
ncbi:MAG: hypothetical protein HC831_12665 [Chloroflexia bacterium]|nr:hypothetical protein [Chloroflexia bacterium]